MLLAVDPNEMRYAPGKPGGLEGSLMNISRSIDSQTGISPLGGGKASLNSPLVDYANATWARADVTPMYVLMSSQRMSNRPGGNSCAFL